MAEKKQEHSAYELHPFIEGLPASAYKIEPREGPHQLGKQLVRPTGEELKKMKTGG